MSRFRRHWLALIGAMLLLSLSLSSAFGAKPEFVDGDDGANRGQQVSDFVHDLIFGDDEEEGDEEEGDEEEGDEEEGDEEEPKNHGHCVREFAWDDLVGGPNENHGGAVSEAARVTCREDDDAEDEDEPAAEEVSEEEVSDATGPARAAEVHERNAQRKAAHQAAKEAQRGGR